jgi:hypothetical protein
MQMKMMGMILLWLAGATCKNKSIFVFFLQTHAHRFALKTFVLLLVLLVTHAVFCQIIQ